LSCGVRGHLAESQTAPKDGDAAGNPVADIADRQENLRVIDRDEIEATSTLLGVHTSDVQRDYLYGWLLAGLYGDNPLVSDRLRQVELPARCTA
jgi:hypothetical protein